MDFGELRERTLGEIGTSLVTEGGGVTAGFVGAAFLGRQIENAVRPGVTAASSFTDKLMAWAANNVPKIGAWYLTRSWREHGGGGIGEAKADARKALAGSVVFDSLMRLGNNGVNPATATVFGWQVLGSGSGESPESQKSMQADVQRLIQENSALRTELNKALQRVAETGSLPAPTERDKRYGFMKNQSAQLPQREKRFGFMEGSSDEKAAQIFNML